MKLLVVVPAFNEGQVIKSTLLTLKKSLKRYPDAEIVVIDDGSTDNTFDLADQVGVTVLRHVLNRGLGGALGTGLKYARSIGCDTMVTIDADGQHDPEDIHPMINLITHNQADVVIGSRVISTKGKIPHDRKILLSLSNLLTQILFGQATSDSLSGFRAFNKKAIKSIEIKTQRMEVSNEFFKEIKKHHLALAEIPIKVIYTNYSRAKGQRNLNGIKIVYKLILRLFR
jgi:glycosyltransferase involved in cell wall biosynthesis